MLKTGILNPQLNSLLSRVRHTNLLVIADRGFPYWPMIETIDIALIDDLPTVLQVLEAIQANFVIGQVTMAQCREIAKQKMADLNAHDVEAAAEMIRGSARSMGVTVEGV